ncbi:PREDICTED: uncharacterized protein LOC106114054 [Papilio xuthus]|uniref:Uncharacterized protein LOC106114054 n=1 Tax=Papilio xuthus TaxID=66420 RepID=A0AAJ7E4N7_PAPXU|nr:PREDICTED: uncharacterized protein LOC106114054 [Papilio xuthus]
MSDVELLRDLVETVASEQGYKDCRIHLKPFSTGGANYTSQLYYVTLLLEGKDDLNLFAKVACVSEHVRKQTSFKIYDTEMYFYTDLLKRYQELEEKHKVPEEHRLATVKFYGCKKEYLKEILILENLSSKGYESYDRFKTFDWEYASKAVTELAKLHALSIALNKQSPEEFKSLSKRLKYDMKAGNLKTIIENVISMALAVIKEENREKLEVFIKKSQEYEFDYFYKVQHEPVIMHGDFRASNIMHRLHEDGHLEVVLLDYQMLNISNPAIDLMYFIFSGSDQEFRRQHYSQLLDHYHTELSNALTRLGVDVDTTYSKENFEADLKEVQPYGLLVGMMMVPMVTVLAEDAPDMSTASGDLANFAIPPNQLAITRLNELVEDFIKWGVL